MSNAQDWLDDLTEANRDDSGPSLFEDNFRKLLEDGELDSLTVQTLSNQADRIDDADLLVEAIEADDREEAVVIYEARISEIEDGEVEDEVTEIVEPDDVEDDEPDVDEVAEAVEDEAVELVEDDDVEDPFEDLGGEPAESPSEDEEEDDDVSPSAEDEADEEPPEAPDEDEDDEGGVDLDVLATELDIETVAPSAIGRHEASQMDQEHNLLVWGRESTGKSHIAHTAPDPIAYIDTEGKADKLAGKFEDKHLYYWQPSDYPEAKAALDEALDVLYKFAEKGITGTLVVDSMGVMWEWAQIDYAKFAYQTEDLSEVSFGSQLQGEKDWTKIKARHNEEFRQVILESPFHTVLTAGQKEKYNYEGGDVESRWDPDGEKHNKYAVDDVVRLRRNAEGQSVGDLHKAALTRYAFVGLEWPEWDDIYRAIEEMAAAEASDDPVDVTDWEFGVVKGQPIDDDGGDDDGE